MAACVRSARAREEWQLPLAWQPRSLAAPSSSPQPPSRLCAAAEHQTLPAFCLPTPATAPASPPRRCFPQYGQLWVEPLHEGDGLLPQAGEAVSVHYSTLLAASGSCIDTSRCQRERTPMRVVIGAHDVVPGLEAGLQTLSLGAVARIHCPASLGYGELGGGHAVPPNADLVFEVEVVEMSARRVERPRTTRELRALFQERALKPIARLPPHSMRVVPRPREKSERRARNAVWLVVLQSRPSDLSPHSSSHHSLDLLPPHHGQMYTPTPLFPTSIALEPSSPAEHHTPPLLAPASRSPCAPLLSHDTGSDDDATAAAEHAPLVAEMAWVRRLRPAAPLPTAETSTFFALVERVGPRAFEAALRSRDAAALLPRTLPIRRVPHGSGWSSKYPSECVVLTGERRDWPGFRWGWSFWEGRCGDDIVVSKQRAPIFDSDECGDTVCAESSLREYIRYARAAHATPSAPTRMPLLYMNGWEVFKDHPELWTPDFDKIPGTIENQTAVEYRSIMAKLGQSTASEDVLPHVRTYCKLFVGAAGVVTRMHQDNHWAHAWLSQVRGRKLYVVCSPKDSSKMRAAGKSADEGGTTREARFDPLDPQQLGERLDAGLQVYATILEPGETIVAPNGWWHYAVSLTPTITLMCNFWDQANVKGLHRMLLKDLKPQPCVEKLANRRVYSVAHRPYVYIREGPSRTQRALGVAAYGTRVEVDQECAGWLHICSSSAADGVQGWVMLDGASTGLGRLLDPCIS
ncbi:hypothetical protein AB1Y20_003901 [Prymnesium parvum]|uniref:peptidylprolyl isomerase n=1 Tax=Prymnesium parvum TaxID=97485 RepID=A0AB34J8C2_PRYPA